MKRTASIVCIAAALLSLACCGDARVVQWLDVTSTTGRWCNPNNWVTAEVPGPTDQVVISCGESKSLTVIVDCPVKVADIVLGGQCTGTTMATLNVTQDIMTASIRATSNSAITFFGSQNLSVTVSTSLITAGVVTIAGPGTLSSPLISLNGPTSLAMFNNDLDSFVITGARVDISHGCVFTLAAGTLELAGGSSFSFGTNSTVILKGSSAIAASGTGPMNVVSVAGNFQLETANLLLTLSGPTLNFTTEATAQFTFSSGRVSIKNGATFFVAGLLSGMAGTVTADCSSSTTFNRGLDGGTGTISLCGRAAVGYASNFNSLQLVGSGVAELQGGSFAYLFISHHTTVTFYASVSVSTKLSIGGATLISGPNRTTGLPSFHAISCSGTTALFEDTAANPALNLGVSILQSGGTVYVGNPAEPTAVPPTTATPPAPTFAPLSAIKNTQATTQRTRNGRRKLTNHDNNSPQGKTIINIQPGFNISVTDNDLYFGDPRGIIINGGKPHGGLASSSGTLWVDPSSDVYLSYPITFTNAINVTVLTASVYVGFNSLNSQVAVESAFFFTRAIVFPNSVVSRQTFLSVKNSTATIQELSATSSTNLNVTVDGSKFIVHTAYDLRVGVNQTLLVTNGGAYSP